MLNEYPPLDDRWVRIGGNAYKLPWEKLTKEEKKRQLIWGKNLKIHKEIKNIMDEMIDNVARINSVVIVQKYFRRSNLIEKIKKLLRLNVTEIRISTDFNDLNIVGLLIMKILEKKGQSRKGVHELIENKLGNIINIKKSKTDGRKTAKKDEDIRVNEICENINNNTELGNLMKLIYYEKFGLEILKVEKKGGNNIHYDILIHHTDGSTNRCEEKGTKRYSEFIDENTSPHENSVEFYNGPGEKFSISNKYLKIWYGLVVNNNEVNQKYNLPEPPPFEEWLKGGPYCMVDPKSDYSIKNKQNYRGLYPDKSMNGWGHSNIDYRIEPNNAFDITDDEKCILIKEVQDIYNDIMGQKDVWLQTTGTINDKFSFKWFDKIEPKKIVDVDLVKKKDIEFIFKLEDNSSFKGIMRWGKGCGFSCFRIDFK